MAKASNRGGKRANSGRQPGPLTTGIALLDTLQRPTTARNLNPRIRAAIAFSCRGLSDSEIERRMGCSRDSVANWRLRYPDIVDDELRKLVDPADSLRRLLPDATQAYADTLHSERDSVKLQAAEAVYDRVYGKPLVRTEAHERRDIRVLLLKASDLTTQDDA